MSNRIKGFTVLLEQDLREDDAADIVNAIRALRHVAGVEPLIADIDDHMARERVKLELRQKLWELLK